RLSVIALLKGLGRSCLHDAGIGIGEVSLSLIGWLGRKKLLCSRLSLLGFSLCGLLVFGSFLFGFFLKSTHGFFDLCQASLSSFEFIGQIPALPAFAVFFILFFVYDLGIFKKPFNFFLKLVFGLLHSAVAHGFVLGGIGFDLCSIKSHMAELNKACFLAEPEGLQEQIGKCFKMSLPELAYGVMIGMPICRNHSERNVLVSLLLDLSGTGNPGAVSVQKKCAHHPGFIRGLAPAIALV